MSALPTAGDLRHRVILERPDETPDGSGGSVSDWRQARALWAQVVPVAPQVQHRDPAAIRRVTHTVRIRFRTDVAPGQRLVFGDRILMIRGVRDMDETRRFLELDCEAR